MRPRLTPQTGQAVTITGTSAQSAAFAASTKYIRLVSTTACWIQFGANPTATTTTPSILLAANVPEFFGVTPGQKVAGIQDAAGGKLSIAEGAQF